MRNKKTNFFFNKSLPYYEISKFGLMRKFKKKNHDSKIDRYEVNESLNKIDAFARHAVLSNIKYKTDVHRILRAGKYNFYFYNGNIETTVFGVSIRSADKLLLIKKEHDVFYMCVFIIRNHMNYSVDNNCVQYFGYFSGYNYISDPKLTEIANSVIKMKKVVKRLEMISVLA